MRFLRALVTELVDDDVLDLGAMLAYYAVLALFPMILFVVALALLVLPGDVLGQGVRMVAEAMPDAAKPFVIGRIEALIQATTGTFAITGAVLVLWGASRGAVALGSALNRVSDRSERRSWIHRQLVAVK